MSVITDMETEMALFRTAVSSGDYLTARRHLLLAQSYLAQLADNKEEDGREMKWRDDLDRMSKSLDSLAVATQKSRPGSGIRRRRVVFKATR